MGRDRAGERWRGVTSTNVGHSGTQARPTAGIHLQEQRRRFVEAAQFTTLKRGGAQHNYLVEAIVYNGGHIFSTEEPFKLLRFEQR